ncbi:hypothetical protein K0H71_02880 [Bacillus sp. IITD106]|nr:hypothetical protein [Bacillus sp. IITD106]
MNSPLALASGTSGNYYCLNALKLSEWEVEEKKLRVSVTPDNVGTWKTAWKFPSRFLVKVNKHAAFPFSCRTRMVIISLLKAHFYLLF